MLPSHRPVGRRPSLALGAHTRAMLRRHVWFVLLTLFAIVGAVTAINVSSEIGRVWAEGVAAGDALGRTVRYVAYRALDNGSQIFPIGCLLGLAWSEAAHAASGRLAIVRTVGMTFARRSAALFLLAAAAIPAQFLLDNVVRPFAFMGLSREGLGEYGWDYAAARKPRTEWLAFGGRVVQAVLQDDPAPQVGPATVYDFDPAGNLLSVAEAGRFAPAAPGSARLEAEARVWKLPPARSEAAAGDEVEQTSDERRDVVALRLSPLWLEYRGIHPKYVPLADLVALARDRALPDHPPPYAEWLAIRAAQAPTLGLAAVCLACVFALALDLWGLLAACAAALAVSYLTHFGLRIAAIAVESHLAPPLAAAMALPAVLALAAALLLRRLRPDEHNH